MFAIVMCLLMLMCTLTIWSSVLCVFMVECMHVVVKAMLSLVSVMSTHPDLCNISVSYVIIIIFIQSPISNVHRDTSSVDYITITYIYNN